MNTRGVQKKWWLWVALCLGEIVSVKSSAQENATSGSVEIALPEAVMLGEAFTLELRVNANTNDYVAVPVQDLGGLEILSRKDRVETGSAGNTQHIFELELIALEANATMLEPIAVHLTTEDGQLHTLYSEARSLQVRSPLANEPNPTLKAPSETISVMQDDQRPLWALAFVATALLGAFTAWGLRRWWRGRPERPATLPPPIPPWEIAMQRLKSLHATRESMFRDGEMEIWVDRVSDVLREYLGKRFDFEGLESTSTEISAALHRVATPIEPKEIMHVLSECDLVKFARADLAEEAAESLIGNAFSIVNRTQEVRESA